MAARPMDTETRAVSDDHGAIRLWLRMLATNRLVETRTRRLLQDRYATTLPRFDLMAQLERAPKGLKMGELWQAHDGDGRQHHGDHRPPGEGRPRRTRRGPERPARLARAADRGGRRAFSAMAEEHEGWIVDAFRELTGREMATMAALLARLKTHVRSLEERDA